MILSWNEIKDRALKFSKEWADTSNEEADAKPFLVEFFNVFGISHKRVSTFEHRVKKLDDSDGYIDLLWKGMILIEMKSRGKNLDRAYGQAKDYLHGLKDHELPKYILISDFEQFRLYDLEENKTIEFRLNELVANVQHFGYLLGYQKKIYKEQDPANIKAAELMGKLHDRLEEIGYVGHPLEVYLVRILFCLFAEDTTIFNKQQFQEFIEQRTNVDGSDLAAKLQELFQVLNTPKENRFKNLDEQLAEFPYVNGKLFEEILPMASFDSKMRLALLDCCYIDWSKISPAIFGSMFQSVMNPKERRNLGAHYTSETNILKLIKPLFLDELWKEFESIKANASTGSAQSKSKLTEFHKKLSSLRFLDPACGCGNFLVITYRELRLLEFEVLKALNKTGQTFLDVSQILWIDVDQFSGIEYEEFPARIAEVAMWLIDHQMNMLVSSEFGQYFVRLPLKKSANIVHGDALEIEWQTLLNPINTIEVNAKHADIYLVNEPQTEYGKVSVKTKTFSIHNGLPEQSNEIKFDYIIGNPPFIGSKVMKQYQRNQIVKVFDGADGSGVLDYVTGWYIKAAKYIQGTAIKVAFVSTNSIVQGEQVSILWGQMLTKYQIKIHFAHRTFKWNNEARGIAAVYCVIVGFANIDSSKKLVYDYEDVKGDPNEFVVKHINPYLLEAKDVFVSKRSTPICNVPKLSFGNMPLDGGNLFLNQAEKDALLDKHPNASKYIKRVFGSEEFLHNKTRYCLWLENAQPNELRQIPEILARIEAVRKFRLASVAPSTQKFASTPSLFRDRRLPKTYLVVPKVSSEKRTYIPLGYFTDEFIATDLLFIIPNCSLYHFGVLSSMMHMVWTKNVCGRLKGDYRYSKDIVYNNFPWPINPNQDRVLDIEKSAQKILDIRNQYEKSSLADLYNITTMPIDLIKAHQELDKAVDKAYRSTSFVSELKRLEFLFELLESYIGNIFSKNKK